MPAGEALVARQDRVERARSMCLRYAGVLLATACASLTARCAQAMTVKVNVSKEPSRRSRIANPAACVFCVLTMVVVVPNLWA